MNGCEIGITGGVLEEKDNGIRVMEFCTERELCT